MEILHLTASDKHRIRLAYAVPEGKPKAVIQFVHGFGEGLEHFEDLAQFLKEKGYAFVVHDQRGFGVEAKRRGVHGSYDCFLNDIERVRGWISEQFVSLPVVLYGFSMGGNIASNFVLKRGETRYDALILESPWFGLYKNPQAITTALAKLLGKISGKFRVKSGLNVQAIMRDKKRLQTVLNDGIYHDIISMRLFTEVRAQGKFAVEQADQVKLPILLLGAERDQIVSLDAIREFAKNAGKNLIYQEIKEAYHCLHYDLDAEKTHKILIDFLNRILFRDDI